MPHKNVYTQFHPHPHPRFILRQIYSISGAAYEIFCLPDRISKAIGMGDGGIQNR